MNNSEDPSVVFKYIEAAVKLNQLKVVEGVCRDHNHYDAKEVKEFLLLANLKVKKFKIPRTQYASKK